ELVRERRRHLPERRPALAARGFELRAAQPGVRLLEIAIARGECDGRMTDARLEAAGETLDALEHAVEALRQVVELLAPLPGDARAQDAVLGAPHGRDELRDRPA